MKNNLVYAVVRRCDGEIIKEFETVAERTTWLLANCTGYCFNKRTDIYWDWEVAYCRVDLVTKERGVDYEEN